jgi:phosphatidate cytidylyltransferase
MMQLSNLQQRLLSSLILIPLVVAIIYMDGWIFGLSVTAAITLSFVEWVSLIQKMELGRGAKTLGILGGIFYLGISCFSFLYLRFKLPEGTDFLIFLMLIVWASDSCAYMFGKTIGGPKMSPTISPKKTWAGYAGALLGPACVLVFCIHVLTSLEYLPHPLFTFGVGILLGITGQSGDLMISAMKRKAGVKDTGAIFPGHGGMLDRIDALLLVVIPYLAFVQFILPLWFS